MVLHELTIAKLTKQLSHLKKFEDPNSKKEQYSTPPEIAAMLIHYGVELGDIVGKKVSDLGAGTGILGIGALFANAAHCTFVEQDLHAAQILKQNVGQLAPHLQNAASILVQDMREYTIKSETILMNPPFGTKERHADKPFFERAMTLAPIIYAFAKTATHRFIESISTDHAFEITHAWRFDSWRLAKSQHWHRKRAEYIDVTLYRLKSIQEK